MTSTTDPGRDRRAAARGREVVRRSVQAEYLRQARSRAVRLRGACDEETRRSLECLCARSELGPFLADTAFQIDAEIAHPFVADDGRLITLRPDTLNRPEAAAVILRHALELSMLQRLLPGQQDQSTRVTMAALACCTAAAYWSGMIRWEKERAAAALPAWYTDLPGGAAADPHQALDHVLRQGAALLPLQGDEAGGLAAVAANADVTAMVHALLSETLALALPAERLLTQGGDNRLLVDPDTGLNNYGCSPKPRPWAVTFASCTASSISDSGYFAAETLRQELLLNAFRHGLADAVLDEADRSRREIVRVLSLDNIPGTETILTSSGTDSELIALSFTLGGHDKRVTNIVMAPDEVGSGTVPAAGGRHFDSLTPMGAGVEPGTPIEGMDVERVEVVKIPVREETGEPIDSAVVDRRVSDVIERECKDGGRVLLHLLDSSKTGVGGPGIEAVRALRRRHGAQLQVLVDAAQMRASRRSLRGYLEDGFMVLITGSKFFTGPPFSSALVIPMATAHQIDLLPPFPEGFADYTTQSDFPNRWRALAAGIPDRPNIGLLLRWKAALWEMTAFSAVPRANQHDTVKRFLTRVIGEIQRNPLLEFVSAPALDRLEMSTEASWDQIQTIYSFFVKRMNADGRAAVPLTHDEAKLAYRWLNMDIAAFLPDGASHEERYVAGVRCHIGQPVRIYKKGGRWYSALRIAVGARLISGVEFDLTMGDTREARLATELEGAMTILRKLTVMSCYWQDLLNAVDGVGPEQPAEF